MARAVGPVGGCPWDLEQTHASITCALVEETYEVIEAISDKDAPHLQEELGDLLLHVLFQTQIARDGGELARAEVGAEPAGQVDRRHPRFGAAHAQNTAWVLENWEKIKQEEKKGKGQSSVAMLWIAGIPRNLPVLVRAQKVAVRARRKNGKAPQAGSRKSSGKHQTAGNAGQMIARKSRDRERLVGELLLEIARKRGTCTALMRSGR